MLHYFSAFTDLVSKHPKLAFAVTATGVALAINKMVNDQKESFPKSVISSEFDPDKYQTLTVAVEKLFKMR